MISFSPHQIQQLIARDEQIFGILYTKTVDMFFRFLTSHYQLSTQEQEDIIADFYVKIRESLPQYRGSGSFEGYLWTSFKNVIHDYFRKNRPVYFAEIGNYADEEGNVTPREDTLSSGEDVLGSLEQLYDIESIKVALRSLDTHTQNIIHLKYVEQASTEYIAQISGLSTDVVRQKLSRGIKKLKQTLLQQRS